MFGIGMPELILIMVIALIIIGPSKLPDLAKAIGKGLAEFRKATQEIKENLNMEEELYDVKEGLIDTVSGINKPLDLDTEKTSTEKDSAIEAPESMTEARPLQNNNDKNNKHAPNQKDHT
jgi:TatA/E family protein of Tat protein translocase